MINQHDQETNLRKNTSISLNVYTLKDLDTIIISTGIPKILTTSTKIAL